jgi:hypothetical protein
MSKTVTKTLKHLRKNLPEYGTTVIGLPKIWIL